MKVLGISGSISSVSRTTALVRAVTDRAAHQAGARSEILDLRDARLPFCDGRDPYSYEGDVPEIFNKVRDADVVVVGTPVYQGSLTGVLKNFLDLLPSAIWRHKIVGLVVTGGTYQHFLVGENQLKPIFSYLRAYIAPGYIYAHNAHFNAAKEVSDPEILERVAHLGDELIHLFNRVGLPVAAEAQAMFADTACARSA